MSGGGAAAETLGTAGEETEAGKRTEGPLSRAGLPWPPGWVAGLALLLTGVGMAVIAGALETQPRPRVIGVNLPVNAGATNALDISAHNSPTLARNPTKPGNLAVANRIDTPRYSCALHVSFDGGATWSPTSIPWPPGVEPKCYAPDVAFGADGSLYLSFVTLKGAGNVPDAAWIARSRDGGRTFSTPVKTRGPLAFQVRLVADPVVPRRLYLTWLQADDVGYLRFSRPGNSIRFARSHDGGASWTAPAQVSGPAHARAVAPSPVLGPRGELYVLYLDLGGDRLDYEGAHLGRGGPPYGGPWKLMLSRSLDRGKTWEETAVEERLVATERFIAFIPPSPSLAVDPDDGRLYAAFQDGRLGDADVRLWTSTDRGARWEGPTRVNDTPGRDRTSQYLPKLAVAEDGRLDVVYYDRRADRRNVMNEVSLQSSFDGGRTFGRRVRLSDRPFDSRIGFGNERGLPDLGSRLGLLSTDRRVMAVWTDTRAGTEASLKQDLSRAVLNFPARTPPAVVHGLFYGGIAIALAGIAVLGLWLRRGGFAAARDFDAAQIGSVSAGRPSN